MSTCARRSDTRDQSASCYSERKYGSERVEYLFLSQPVSLRETLSKGAGYGTKEETYPGADGEPAASERSG
jgi:hypothetical protein